MSNNHGIGILLDTFVPISPEFERYQTKNSRKRREHVLFHAYLNIIRQLSSN